MTQLSLTKTGIKNGAYEGHLRSATSLSDAPALTALHFGEPVDGLTLTPHPSEENAWRVTLPLPVSAISDGVQTFLILDAQTNETLDHFSIVSGQPVEADLVSELDLLRSELYLLKRAFREHCNATGA